MWLTPVLSVSNILNIYHWTFTSLWNAAFDRSEAALTDPEEEKTWNLDADAGVQPHWGSSGFMAKEAGSGRRWTRPHTEGTCVYKHSGPTGHISCQYSKFFSFSSTPTTGSSLFKIMKPQREPAGLCRSIWPRHRRLPGRTLDPSNWLRRQHEMDKWEAPPEWPDGWRRNEEACLVSHESFSVLCFVCPSLG